MMLDPTYVGKVSDFHVNAHLASEFCQQLRGFNNFIGLGYIKFFTPDSKSSGEDEEELKLLLPLEKAAACGALANNSDDASARATAPLKHLFMFVKEK